MITKEDLQKIIINSENFRIEKTISISNTEKFCEAICAFANDMPNSKLNGYLLIGVHDNGRLSGLKITDELMKNMASIRSDGNILPFPSMTVAPFSFEDGDVLVVEVQPSFLPPVRYKGRPFIRMGPRKSIATLEEERILAERVTVNCPTFDATPCVEASLEDIDTELFIRDYLPKAIDSEILANDKRTIKEQMSALRLFNLKMDCPTYAAVILFAKNPKYFLMGNYIQFVRFNGLNNAANILNEHEFIGNLVKLLPVLDSFVETSLIVKRPIPISILREKTHFNFPKWSIRELVMNAVMHRNYQSTMPTKLYAYSDRIEIVNSGGLYGEANSENFPNVSAYRNPIIAEAMKILGFVNKFNRGISRVQEELIENGNGKAIFSVDKITVFEAKVNLAGKPEDYLKSDSSETISAKNNKVKQGLSNKQITSNENLARLQGCNLATLQLSKVELQILEYCNSDYRSKEDIATSIKRSVNYLRNEIIPSLVAKKLLLQLHKERPNHPKQAYKITELGNDYLIFKNGGNDEK